MKKLLCLLISALMLGFAGCSDASADNVDIPAGSSIVINDPSAQMSTREFDYKVLSQKTGIEISTTDYLYNDFYLKILAGDSDVDIYFVRPTEIRLLTEKGIYTPLESEIISEFNSKCFDYIKEYCEVDGQTVYMPVYAGASAILVPKGAIEETGMTYSDIEHLDGYLSFARNYTGDRIAFTNGGTLFEILNLQYEKFYCDFENGDVNYMTPEYFDLYEKMLSGYLRYAQNPGAPEGFVHNSGLADGVYDGDIVLMTYDLYFNNGDYSDFFEKWRAFPIPKISDNITQNYIDTTYAMINPYSENKEAALRVLEEIALDYYGYAGYYNRCTLMFEDKSDYPEHYHTDSDIFNDFYDIANNGFISSYVLFTSHPDIEEYQNGRATLEEAVAMYQREVEMWLNE